MIENKSNATINGKNIANYAIVYPVLPPTMLDAITSKIKMWKEIRNAHVQGEVVIINVGESKADPMCQYQMSVIEAEDFKCRTCPIGILGNKLCVDTPETEYNMAVTRMINKDQVFNTPKLISICTEQIEFLEKLLQPVIEFVGFWCEPTEMPL